MDVDAMDVNLRSVTRDNETLVTRGVRSNSLSQPKILTDRLPYPSSSHSPTTAPLTSLTSLTSLSPHISLTSLKSTHSYAIALLTSLISHTSLTPLTFRH